MLYLGDLDLAGERHIEANTRRVLERLRGALRWERVALTLDQVRDYNVPPMLKTDHRFKGDRGIHEAYETEALSQTVIVDIVRQRLDELLPEPLANVLERAEGREDRAPTGAPGSTARRHALARDRQQCAQLRWRIQRCRQPQWQSPQQFYGHAPATAARVAIPAIDQFRSTGVATLLEDGGVAPLWRAVVEASAAAEELVVAGAAGPRRCPASPGVRRHVVTYSLHDGVRSSGSTSRAWLGAWIQPEMRP